jgi:hypothetical protein
MRMNANLKLIGAVALAAIGVSIAAAPKARADQDWQSGIILCMANPAGPMAAGPSRVSDMNELTAWLADPVHSWPKCAGMGGSNVQKAIYGDVYIYQTCLSGYHPQHVVPNSEKWRLAALHLGAVGGNRTGKLPKSDWPENRGGDRDQWENRHHKSGPMDRSAD